MRKTLQIQNRFPARLRVNVIQFIRRAALVGTLDHVVADGHDLENAEIYSSRTDSSLFSSYCFL